MVEFILDNICIQYANDAIPSFSLLITMVIAQSVR